ncbi:hypothetical protein HD554DRAFT_930281 [Boletus coccyginus]|nr:hypothetical protein HD554DRAFT_930281 [Boletus coccyginus]
MFSSFSPSRVSKVKRSTITNAPPAVANAVVLPDSPRFRFRILVVGRANAGKTTLLQRLCKSTDSPIVRNRAGEKIDIDVKGTVGRGGHDIEHEISFKDNERFVFHDSRGFDAGSEDELQKVQSFIEERAKEQEPANRLHAIWYCIPMNEHGRPITSAEEFFFSKGVAGNVPVIAVFTKFDALHTIAFGELMEQGKGIREARDMAPKHAEEIFRRNDYYGMLQNKKFPPKDFVCTAGMNKDQADCTALITCTAGALDNKTLESLVVSNQHPEDQGPNYSSLRQSDGPEPNTPELMISSRGALLKAGISTNAATKCYANGDHRSGRKDLKISLTVNTKSSQRTKTTSRTLPN